MLLLTRLWNTAFRHGGYCGAGPELPPRAGCRPGRMVDDAFVYRTAAVAGDEIVQQPHAADCRRGYPDRRAQDERAGPAHRRGCPDRGCPGRYARRLQAATARPLPRPPPRRSLTSRPPPPPPPPRRQAGATAMSGPHPPARGGQLGAPLRAAARPGDRRAAHAHRDRARQQARRAARAPAAARRGRQRRVADAGKMTTGLARAVARGVPAHRRAKTHERYAEIVQQAPDPGARRDPAGEARAGAHPGLLRRGAHRGRLDGKGGLSPQTVVHLDRVLNSALKRARALRLIAANPLEGVDAPRSSAGRWGCSSRRGGRPAARRGGDHPAVRADLPSARHRPAPRRAAGAALGGRRPDDGHRCAWCDRSSRPRPGCASRPRRRAQPADDRAVGQRRRGAAGAPGPAARGAARGSGSAGASWCSRARRRARSPRTPSAAEFARVAQRAGVAGSSSTVCATPTSRSCCARRCTRRSPSERVGHSSVGFTLDRYSHVVPGLQEDAARAYRCGAPQDARGLGWQSGSKSPILAGAAEQLSR